MSVPLAILAGTALAGTGLQIGGAIKSNQERKRAAEQMWTPEDEARLKELLRQQREGTLGEAPGRKGRIMQSQMDPVQAAEREAQAKTAAQFAAAVGAGGQYFRGTQAMQETSQKQRSEAAQAATEQERIARQQQEAMKQAEIAQLKQQNQMAAQMLTGGGQTAMQVGQAIGDLGMQGAMIAQQQQQIDIMAKAAGSEQHLKEQMESMSMLENIQANMAGANADLSANEEWENIQ